MQTDEIPATTDNGKRGVTVTVNACNTIYQKQSSFPASPDYM